MILYEKRKLVIGTVAFLVLAVAFSLLLIVVFNQYNEANYSYDNTLRLELTYKEYKKQYIYRAGTEIKIYTEELDKPIYFETLTVAYCDINERLLSDTASGEKFVVYVVQSSSEKYEYEIIEMKFDNDNVVLSISEYNKGHRTNAVIGFIIVPIMAVLCLGVSGYFLIKVIRLRK